MTERQKPGSFQEILEQNQQFISHLQDLQESADAQLAARQDELVQTRARLEQAMKELTTLRHDKLEWATARQALSEELETLKKQHAELKVAYDNMKAEWVEAFWHLVDWFDVSTRFAKARTIDLVLGD